jgi:hypothetical protein
VVGEVAGDAPAGLDLPGELAGGLPPRGVLRKGEPAAGRIDVHLRRHAGTAGQVEGLGRGLVVEGAATRATAGVEVVDPIPPALPVSGGPDGFAIRAWRAPVPQVDDGHAASELLAVRW